MTSFRQIEANRKNAHFSTGPRTGDGKRQSRRNALRHGLTAETVISGLEDGEDYRAFEAAIIADYDARTAVERELVLRLASLLWRLRRIISIETDLFKIQSDMVSEHRVVVDEPSPKPKGKNASNTEPPLLAFDSQPEAASEELRHCYVPPMSIRDLTCCFLRLSNVDNGAFERLGRYNAALWKQTAQTFFLLQAVRRPQL
jgi:hypothetical protein